MNQPPFALLGAAPAFAEPLPVGQLYFPSRERYEAAFRGIFERQYYTEYGPLCQQLEERLQAFLGVRHVICVTNATIGLMMVANAMELTKKVILPSFTFIASAQSLTWAGLEPVFCDVDPKTHQIAIDQIDALIDKDVSAIMGVHLWGGACDPEALEKLAASYGVQLYFDAAHAFGCRINEINIGNFGSAEVFSFHATKVLSASEGGCICTNDDVLAARLRKMRSSAGADKQGNVLKTVNGRMSEAQAAIALMSLEDFPENQNNNEVLYQVYQTHLAAVPGMHLVKPSGISFSNYQYVVCQVDENKFGLPRDLLIDLLRAENVVARRYFYPGLHRSTPYAHDYPQYLDRLPNTDRLSASCIQLPIGALVTPQAVEKVCNILKLAHFSAPAIRAKLEFGKV